MECAGLSSQFESLLPLVVEWAAEQEQIILRRGVPLSAREMSAARAVGVEQPERVRVLAVDVIPSPGHPLLQAVCQATNFVPAAPRGLTLRYGIFVRADSLCDRTLLVHELVHTAQYERLGGFGPFLRQYLAECATVGYDKSPMETEAETAATRLCSVIFDGTPSLARYREPDLAVSTS